MIEQKKENRNYWKYEEELIIKNWADKAQCYQWLHSRCREIYQKKNAMYTIPVIIISTITGTANFAQDRFPEDLKQYIIMGIGTLSIFAGIITTIYQFLQISELNEGHRVAVLSWTKFQNTLKTLILRHPLDRMPPNEAIKIYQDEYERLIEVSPVILKDVLSTFNSKFKKNMELVKPEICSKLESAQIYNMSTEERNSMIDKINNKTTNKKIENTFFSLTGRNPSEQELLTLNESSNITIEPEERPNSDESESLEHIFV